MPRNSRCFYSRAIAAALVFFVALGPVFSIRAYAAGTGQDEGQEGQSGAPVHKYVITNKSDDPAYWHDQDCRQDIDGKSVAPGDPEWPDEYYGGDLDEEHGLLGHHDGRCYKTYIDDPTLEQPERPLEQPDDQGDGGAADPAADDDFEHGDSCVQIDHLVCEDTSPDHEHGDDCYESGWVDDMGWTHDDSCIEAPYKPGITTLEENDDSPETQADSVTSEATITITPSKSEVFVGEEFEYIIVIDNFQSPNPSNGVRVNLRLDFVDGIEFVNTNTNTYDPETNGIRAGSSVVFHGPVEVRVKVKATKVGDIEETVRLHSFNTDITVSNDVHDTAVVKVLPAGDKDLPATGGEGDGFILAVGIAGCLAGFATLALLRKRDFE